MKDSIRDLLICVSLANFALLAQWRLVLDCNRYLAPIRPSHFLAVAITSLTLTAIFWCGSWTARRSGIVVRTLAKLLFLQIFALCVASIWTYYFGIAAAGLMTVVSVWTSYFGKAVTAGLITIIAEVSLLAVRFRFHRWAAMLLLACFPCTMFLGLRSVWEMYHVAPASIVRGSLARSSVEGQRVLLLVFDEMSEYVAFEHRPLGVDMPAFDRLRREAFVATAAYPPGNVTIQSVPALLTGQVLNEVQAVSAHELRITYGKDGHSESLTDSKTLFSDAHALGLGTTLIGWYHPYCSSLNDLDYCAHFKTGIASPGIYERGGLVTKIVDLMSQAGPVVNHTPWAAWRRAEAFRETHEIETSALEAIVRENLARFRSGVAVLHLPVPHPPALKGPGMYFANLPVADEELAAIRRIMESAGTWDGTTVLVTSDHNWRAHEWKSLALGTEPENAYIDTDKDKRVPFIVKMPRQKNSASYAGEFNTVLTRSVVQGILAGQIKTPQALIQWLDLHRKDAPVSAYSFVHTRE